MMDFQRTIKPVGSLRLLLVVLIPVFSTGELQGQIRTKKPDRGVYQPPEVQVTTWRIANKNATQKTATPKKNLAPANRDFNLTSAPKSGTRRASQQLVDTTLEEAVEPRRQNRSQVQPKSAKSAKYRRPLRTLQIPTPPPEGNSPIGRGNIMFDRGVVVTGDTVSQPIISDPMIHDSVPNDIVHDAIPSEVVQGAPIEGEVVYPNETVYPDEAYTETVDPVPFEIGGCDGCDSCGGSACDAMGCSSRCLPKTNGFISFQRERWFGTVDLMLMFRSGDRLPPLVTTGGNADADTAGELGVDGTALLVGGGTDSVFYDMTLGGRVQLGTWLDNHQSRSLILRGWFAGEEKFGFAANQGNFDVIARPFLNVTDGQAEEQDTQLIAFPNRADGSISVSGDSNIFGGDVSVRQFWHGQDGVIIDLLYGYQFLRFDENLSINSTSVSLDEDFAPLGAVISVSDLFDIENEFHGGQLGVASNCRYGCWSFNTLAKVGFGSLARRANLSGQTTTSVDGVTAVDPNGLLVRSTNAGDTTDHTFAWVPEIDLTLGYHRFPNYEVTFGYHIIAVTESLQVSDVLDPDLAVNLAEPPTGRQSPARAFEHDTFYVHGLHFGLQYVR